MPGETALPVSEYPDEFGVINRGFNPAGETTLPIWVPDRDIIIDSWTIRYEVAGGAAVTAKLSQVPNGTVVGGTNVDITGTVLVDQTAGTMYTSAVVATANLVKAGALVLLEFSADPTSLLGVSLTIRYRTRRR